MTKDEETVCRDMRILEALIAAAPTLDISDYCSKSLGYRVQRGYHNWYVADTSMWYVYTIRGHILVYLLSRLGRLL